MNDVITAPDVSVQDDAQDAASISHENWTSMIKPKRLEISYGTEPSRRATFIAAPLERGFGLTLGNSLRRVLLSHLHGAAVTSIHIEGVLHEFSSIPGVVEDVTDIILNIKALAIRLLSDGSKRLSLNVTGPKVVTAGDITVPGGVEIMNKEFVLFNIDKDASVNIEMTVDHGKGYLPASASNTEGNVIGDIPIDAIFTPVKRVSYKVDNVRVGRDTDYDRVTFEIETNGTVSPENALAIASNILRDQLQSFIKFDEPQPEVAAPTPQLPFNSNLLKRIDEMELSVRSANCLKSDNIIYIGDLVHRSERDMLCTPNFGRKSLNEIKEVLATMGLHLGMKVVSWPPENIEELAQHTRETIY